MLVTVKYIDVNVQKSIEAAILKDFSDYCVKNGLRYYLYAGTLLGAVRHQGFIPWDDDIDVVMPRPDYEKFYTQVQKSKIAPHLDIETYRISEHSICPFIKLVDNRTDGHEQNLPSSFHTAVWIDIFPLDGVPDRKSEQRHLIKKQKHLIKLLDLCTRQYIPCKDLLRHMKRYMIWKVFGRINYKDIDKQLELNSLKYDYDSSRYIGNTVYCDGMNEIITKQEFEIPVQLEFEGYQFNAPKNYDQYLTNLYGNYMKYPPLKERVRRHDYICWWKKDSEGKNA